MLCDKCRKNEANVHVTHVINGIKYEQNLCSECAQVQAQSGRMGLAPGGSALEQVMNFFRNVGVIGLVMSPGGIQVGEQPGCVTETPDLEQLGLHTPGTGTDGLPTLDSLRAELSSAVAHEHFERAAELRDQIFQREQEELKGRA